MNECDLLPDKRNVDTEVAMDRAALEAEKDAEWDAAPVRVLCVAVRAHLMDDRGGLVAVGSLYVCRFNAGPQQTVGSVGHPDAIPTVYVCQWRACCWPRVRTDRKDGQTKKKEKKKIPSSACCPTQRAKVHHLPCNTAGGQERGQRVDCQTIGARRERDLPCWHAGT